MKDFKSVSLKKIKFYPDRIEINNKSHSFSFGTNILFFKEIQINTNAEILGFQAYKPQDNLYIVSLSREQITKKIEELYNRHRNRIHIIEKFFDKKLDNWELKINRSDLPPIETFVTSLPEKTVNIGIKLIEENNLLFVEGKPGVGKSHYAEILTKNENILYRFWVSSQDKSYEERLKYPSFIADMSKKAFDNYEYKTDEQLIEKLGSIGKTVVIDGLDHVEMQSNCSFQTIVV